MNTASDNLPGKRVIVGLSGGVDSAVAAALLQQRGANVHALHMTNWDDDDGYCTAAADLQDARKVCAQLGIPLHHVNFAREYRDQVFEHFLAEYRAGRTPNPDVLCNREIKFGAFRDYAKRLGGDLIATGHYAACRTVDGQTALYRARDKAKDQSYFLHAVSADALAETVFPLAELRKEDIRDLARTHGLAVHDKKDSTGICFIGERPFREFLATFLVAEPGPIRTAEGRGVGEHRGLPYYTLGQRQGLGIGGRRDAGDAPWYVVAKEPAENALVVAQGDHPSRFHHALLASAAHWINGRPGALLRGEPLHCVAMIRYRQEPQPCTVTAASDASLEVSFEQRQVAIAPGQYVVFYEQDSFGERCLGGAVIDKAVAGDNVLRKTG